MDLKPATYAATTPDKPAVVVPSTGEVVTYAELEERSRRLAALLAERGLGVGDHIAVLLPNTAAYYAVVWAGLRSGLYITPVNWHLTADEAAYIVGDCGATALVSSGAVDGLAVAVASRSPLATVRLAVDRPIEGFEWVELAGHSSPGVTRPVDSSETEGMVMFYSSGTTGRPKGITRELSGNPFGTGSALEALQQAVYGFGPDTTYLCPAPLYHAAPLGWSIGTQRLGGTVVLMERFDPAEALRLIGEHRVTHVQMVPTMFIRMLKLPQEVRDAADTSSLRRVIHAAAPCPVEVKEQMIEWWGPIIDEYYAGSEGNGFCAIGAAEWLAHKGSVGKPLMGEIHIVGDDGAELPTGEVGTVWFGGTGRFEYHGDAEKTASAFNAEGWSTLGDVGRLDEDGYLYLTDRRTHLIISGGVNIYPQEVENVLVLHPAVMDAGVIGLPDEEMGERVVAVVQPLDPSTAGPDLADELRAFCRQHLAGFKCPRQVLFDAELPRTPTGKLAKQAIKDRLST